VGDTIPSNGFVVKFLLKRVFLLAFVHALTYSTADCNELGGLIRGDEVTCLEIDRSSTKYYSKRRSDHFEDQRWGARNLQRCDSHFSLSEENLASNALQAEAGIN
jgi:hypothetical protein